MPDEEPAASAAAPAALAELACPRCRARLPIPPADGELPCPACGRPVELYVFDRPPAAPAPPADGKRPGTPPPLPGRCPRHPGRAATVRCADCGRLVCELCIVRPPGATPGAAETVRCTVCLDRRGGGRAAEAPAFVPAARLPGRMRLAWPAMLIHLNFLLGATLFLFVLGLPGLAAGPAPWLAGTALGLGLVALLGGGRDLVRMLRRQERHGLPLLAGGLLLALAGTAGALFALRHPEWYGTVTQCLLSLR